MMTPPSANLGLLLKQETWEDNPFLTRDLRRDAREREPARTLVAILSTLLFCAAATLSALSLAASLHGRHIPWFLGGGHGNALMLVLSGVHAAFILHASHRRGGLLATHAEERSLLPALVCTPQPALVIVVRSMAYPWLAGMAVAFAGLPFYLACAAVDGPSLGEVALLFLGYALLCLVPPVVRGPALEPSDGVGEKPLTPAERRARATNEKGRGLEPVWIYLLMIIFWGIVIGVLSTQGLRPALAGVVGTDSPLLALIPGGAVGWPYLAARLLATPFDWFGQSLPPAAFVLPSMLLARWLAVERAALLLRVGALRELAVLPEYARARWLGAALGWFVLLGATGYLWHWAVLDGRLGLLTAVTGPSGGVAGFVFLGLLVMAAFGLTAASSLGEWQRELARKGERCGFRLQARSALYLVARPFMLGTLFVAACCLLGDGWDWPAALWRMAGRMLVVAVAGCCVAYAANRTVPQAYAYGALLLCLGLFGTPLCYPLSLLSPAVALLAQGNPGWLLARFGAGDLPANVARLASAPPAWWSSTAVLLCGAALFGAAAAWRARRRPATAVPETLLDRAAYPAEVFAAAAATERRALPPAAARRLEFLLRFTQNAVAERELRRRAAVFALHPLAFCVSAAATAAVFLVPYVDHHIATPLRKIVIGYMPPGPAATLAGALCLCSWMLEMGAFVGLLSSSDGLFADERREGTLAELAMTPMSAKELVGGKVLAQLAVRLFALLNLALPVVALAGMVGYCGYPRQASVAAGLACLEAVLMVAVGICRRAAKGSAPMSPSAALAGFLALNLCNVLPWQILIAASRHRMRYLRHGLIQFAGPFAGFLVVATALVCAWYLRAGLVRIEEMRRGEVDLGKEPERAVAEEAKPEACVER